MQSLAQRRGGADIELVINGDFVDFLAEPGADGEWRPFIADAREAAVAMRAIVARDQALFDALRDLLAAGHRLTLLLGNHDVELAFPAVRQVLRDATGATDARRFVFLYDGEAYRVGDALIEHGNRYDGFNVVDHDAVRAARSLQSRDQVVDVEVPPPPGSRIVAEVMNPIKREYPFVDLLKPETEAVLPLLLALEPGFRSHVTRIARFKAEAVARDPKAPARPRFDANVSDDSGLGQGAFDGGGAARPADPLAAVLARALPSGKADRFLDDLEPEDRFSADVSAGGAARMLGLAWIARGPDGFGRRLDNLLTALRALADDHSFDRDVEGQVAYIEAAEDLAGGAIRHVVMGHTHLAKRVQLTSGGYYLNSGTWADLIRVPETITRGPVDAAREALWGFATELASGQLDAWIEFRPTYVRLDLTGDRVVEASLHDWPA